jgi:hypothetical protein
MAAVLMIWQTHHKLRTFIPPILPVTPITSPSFLAGCISRAA